MPPVAPASPALTADVVAEVPLGAFVGSLLLVMALALLVFAVARVLIGVGVRRPSIVAAVMLPLGAGGHTVLTTFVRLLHPAGASPVSVPPVLLAPLAVLTAAALVGGAGLLVRWGVARGWLTAATWMPLPGWSTSQHVVVVVLGVLLAWCALGTFMWDEASTHWPLGGLIARGAGALDAPLTHPLFPGQPLRYHTGFPVAVGLLAASTGLPLEVACDVVTVVGMVSMLWVLRDLGVVVAQSHTVAETNRGALWFLAGTLLLGGPLAAWLADGWGARLPGLAALRAVLPEGWVNGATFPPLVVANIFQHPQGFAMPLVLALLLLVAHRSETTTTTPRATVALAASLVPFVLQAQVLFGAVVWGGLVVFVAAGHCVTATATRRAWSATALELFLLVVGAVVAVETSTMVGGGASGIVVGAGYFARDGRGAVLHELLAFGIGMLALPAVLLLRRRPHRRRFREVEALWWALAAMGTVGFVVANIAHYERSWDIVKCFGVSLFCGGGLIAVAVGDLAGPSGTLRSRVVVAVLVVSTWSSVFWLLRHGPLQGIVAREARETPPSSWAVQVANACGRSLPPTSRVWSSSLDLGRTGILTPGTHWRASRDTAALLLDRARVEADAAAWVDFRRRGTDLALDTLGADWVVATDADARRLRLSTRPTFQLICRAEDAWVFRRLDPIGGQP